MGKTEICEKCNGKGYGRCVCENAPSSCTVDSIVGCLTEILREAHRCPDDSLVDIANDAFLSHGVSLLAAWTDDDSDPIMVAPNNGKMGIPKSKAKVATQHEPQPKY